MFCYRVLIILTFVYTCNASASLESKRNDSHLGSMKEKEYKTLVSRELKADGPEKGRSAYELIRQFAGPRSIESPDLYVSNHPGKPHIFEDSDTTVGPHFVFVTHRDHDMDRGRVEITDRQRNEIKIYRDSDAVLKAEEGQSFVYSWKFKLDKNISVSKRFTHFFQLKAVGGQASHPIVTLSGNLREGSNGMELRHSPRVKDTVLARTDLNSFFDEWVDVYCRVTFSEKGALRFVATRLRDGAVLLEVGENRLDLWRGTSKEHFVRPKWGIYRSLLDRGRLNKEDSVRFADFLINRIEPLK